MNDLLEAHYLGFVKNDAYHAWAKAYADGIKADVLLIQAKTTDENDGEFDEFYMVVSKRLDVDLDIATYLSGHLTTMNDGRAVYVTWEYG